ncbi:Swt1 family HEPN domain-containing protein [Pelagerythrobacter marinus]|uniref:Swt1 family HEPN domain-containing protein n=1 Tax=Pelagerythrobacter marinus TaxID=538382 RepID=UPI002036F409|nr:Swt1 family HEPN domain-containing protein [Pelagerythrobacter marinus]USA39756.1 Swt1 family HEPN domain-containing protein [Pelagerythrobacter marinus]WPZ06113.1 Swt1 family HEPN domain-containing protein [Pelagerythrobacter marinus]
MSQVKRFGSNNLLIEAAIAQVQNELKIRLSETVSVEEVLDETYYPQFDERVREEAASMAANFRIFYCLENSIRELIEDALREAFDDEWWKEGVPEDIGKEAEKLRQREIDAGAVPRSENLLDYTTFGQLAQIIEQRKDAFEGKFTSFKAVNRVLWQLNMLRGPIAHCKPLAEDEVMRLHLTLRDWFRAQGE